MSSLGAIRKRADEISARQAAQKLVDDIVKQHGYVRAATMDKVGQMSQEARREIEDAFLKKDELIGANIITLAKNLYSNNARFVFELLQNADDNQFEMAKKANEPPHVSFDLHLHQHRIVIECNEDGFTIANLVAISNLGKSSKSNAQAYIGEKGIGFKSIFKVAYKVLIQSGDFTFCFNHRKGDSGMGMICPDWEPDVPSLGQGKTRMTLFLHQDEDSESQSQSIRDQFKDLHGEMLLFLKNLKKITVRTFDEAEELELTTTYGVSTSLHTNRRWTEVKTQRGSTIESETRYFHVTKYMATDLPRSNTRDYAQAEVVLAFPLSKDSVPIEKDQSVFAFLPLCDVGFKFVMHADFVTTANRQDIETTSARNKKIVSSIAEAFVKGALELCDDKTLQYQWMRYVPQSGSSVPRGPFWADVVKSIRERLQQVPLLLPASSGPFRRICDLVRLTKDFRDDNQKPLFADITPEVYISPGYSFSDLGTLRDLGIKYLAMDGIVDRVRCDLNSSSSRMKTSINEDWHSRAANILSGAFENNWEHSVREIRDLNLIPLQDGSWAFGNSGPVYFPETHGLEIPKDINIRIIKPTASSNSDRRALFEHLGAQVASVQFVRDKILQQYSGPFPNFLDSESSMAHLRFLYLSHHTIKDFTAAKDIFILTKTSQKRNPTLNDTYLPCDDELGASKLLAPTPAGSGEDDGAPGFEVQFLHDIYLRQPPDQPPEVSLTWHEWLCKHLNIRTTIRFVDRDEDRLTSVCLYVSKHRPQKFMSLLFSVWPDQRESILESRRCLTSLERIEVLCQDGHYRGLHHTYLPTEKSKKLAAKFLQGTEDFPWLQVEEAFSHSLHPQACLVIWQDVCSYNEDDMQGHELAFCLDILSSLRKSDSVLDQSFLLRVCRLYLYLEARVLEFDDIESTRQTVRAFFEDDNYVLHPSHNQEDSGWTTPEACLWESPLQAMNTVHVLKPLYSACHDRFDDGLPHFESFFKKTLQIGNCSWSNIVGELAQKQREESPDVDGLLDLYACLHAMQLSSAEDQSMKTRFAAERLICSFVDSPPTWHSISECLWQSATRIPGKTPLNNKNDYDDLKDFFLKRLKVPTMTIDLLYGKLKGHSSPENIEEIKGDLVEFSALLGTERKEFDPDPVRANSIFPVKIASGEVMLVPADSEFAIIDRTHLAKHFFGKAQILDFGMEEVHRLGKFIEWIGLEDRYLSRSVKEIFSADRASTQPLSQAERAINLRAHAILRISLYFGSPRTEDRESQQSFYDLVRNSETLETNEIHTTLLLSQDGQSHSVEIPTGNALQIDDSDGKLKIFLPRDRSDQEMCFHSKLPKHLFDWIMDYPTAQPENTLERGLRVLQCVLTASPSVLRGILEEHGIHDVSVGEHDTLNSDEQSITAENCNNPNVERDVSLEQENHSANSSFSSDGFDVITPAQSPPSASRQAYSVPLRARAQWQPHPHVAESSPPPVYVQPTADMTAQYHGLVERVVAAGRRAEIPHKEALNQDFLVISAPSDPFVLRHTDRMERDRMIGAAGEVYVFEMLKSLRSSSLSIPGFGTDNWQSTIRHYVNCHQRYEDLERWVGRETADITFNDGNSAFWSLLVDKGYISNTLTQDSHGGHYPEADFFIEVKATTGPCDTPFYMSKHQYRRMQDSSLTSSSFRKEKKLDHLYVIFRVYNLGLDSVGVRVLFDPEGMRQRGELNFTAESWSVTT